MASGTVLDEHSVTPYLWPAGFPLATFLAE